MRTLVKLAGLGWGRENPSYRQVFTSLLIPDSSAEQAASYNELERMCTTPECAAREASTSSWRAGSKWLSFASTR